MKSLYYLLFLVGIVVLTIIYIRIEWQQKKKNPQTSDLAVEPDLLIRTADRYLNDGKRKVSVESLEQAIAIMKLLEKTGDSVSINAIEVAIHDLEAVEKHIKAEDINEDLMYEAFADAMNSLAYASLRVSERLIVEGKQNEADKTLHYAIEHLQNSIKYARGGQKEEEIKIAQELQDIIENHLTDDLSVIDEVMEEIDSVVQAHVIN